jgi:hypothetical protein
MVYAMNNESQSKKMCFQIMISIKKVKTEKRVEHNLKGSKKNQINSFIFNQWFWISFFEISKNKTEIISTFCSLFNIKIRLLLNSQQKKHELNVFYQIIIRYTTIGTVSLFSLFLKTHSLINFAYEWMHCMIR